jgi:hypothetical protein
LVGVAGVLPDGRREVPWDVIVVPSRIGLNDVAAVHAFDEGLFDELARLVVADCVKSLKCRASRESVVDTVTHGAVEAVGGRGHAHLVGPVLSVQGAVSAFEGNVFGGGWDGARTVEMSDEVVAEGVKFWLDTGPRLVVNRFQVHIVEGVEFLGVFPDGGGVVSSRDESVVGLN